MRTTIGNLKAVVSELIAIRVKNNDPIKEMADLLMRVFDAPCCIVSFLDPKETIIFGKIPHKEMIAEEKKEDFIESWVIRKAMASLESGDTIPLTVSIREEMVDGVKVKYTLGISATILRYKGKVLGTVMVVKEKTACRSTFQNLHSIRSHLNSVVTRSLGLD